MKASGLQSATKATITVTVPVRTVSELNVREHWAKRAKRARLCRETVWWAVYVASGYLSQAPKLWLSGPLTVTLTRLGGRRMDDDNLSGSLKHVRDGVAKWLGVDDGDPGVTWHCGQESGGGQSGVRVQIEAVLRTEARA